MQFGANAANYTVSRVHAKGSSLQRMVDLAAPQAEWTCLDVATAAGHTAFAFAPNVAHVVATDLTPAMLDEARREAERRGIENVSFEIADAEALPFPDARFACVTCRIAPHHFDRIDAFLSEVARVLAPAGLLVLVDNLAPDRSTDPSSDEADLADAARAYNAFEKARDPSHVRALTQSEWLEAIKRAGFSIEAVEHLDKVMSFDAWCSNMSVGGDQKAALRQALLAADGALARYLTPAAADGDDVTFRLVELLVLARR